MEHCHSAAAHFAQPLDDVVPKLHDPILHPSAF
jgi:hypothetical protein